LKQNRKKILWRICFIVAIAAIAMVLFVSLFFQRPKGFTNPQVSEEKHVSKYLTHELSPKFYEGLQRQEPFDLVITQEGINDIILHGKWPQESGGLTFLAPRVFFADGSIILIGTVVFKDVDFVVTIVVAPSIDENGLLSVEARQVKIGAVSATILVKAIAKSIYQNKLSERKRDANNITFQLVGALLADESIEPILKVGDRIARLNGVEVDGGKIVIGFEPFRQ
jgi:hypothetical protein